MQIYLLIFCLPSARWFYKLGLCGVRIMPGFGLATSLRFVIAVLNQVSAGT
jgi:hypothetical protein